MLYALRVSNVHACLFLQALFGNSRNSQETLYVPLQFRRVGLSLALS